MNGLQWMVGQTPESIVGDEAIRRLHSADCPKALAQIQAQQGGTSVPKRYNNLGKLGTIKRNDLQAANYFLAF